MEQATCVQHLSNTLYEHAVDILLYNSQTYWASICRLQTVVFGNGHQEFSFGPGIEHGRATQDETKGTAFVMKKSSLHHCTSQK